jgi:hypothetical protein
MKKALIFLAVLGLTASLGAQSVADLAKREKERREGLKGRHAVVVKNRDLLRVQKLPAVEVTNPDTAVGEDGMGEAQAVDPATISSNADQAVPLSGSGAPPVQKIVPPVAADGSTLMGSGESVNQASSGETLEVQLKAAADLVDLLTLKLSALRQQYEFQDAMVPGTVIQEQIVDTNQRLVKAQAQQARIQAEIDKRGPRKKDAGAADR